MTCGVASKNAELMMESNFYEGVKLIFATATTTAADRFNRLTVL